MKCIIFHLNWWCLFQIAIFLIVLQAFLLRFVVYVIIIVVVSKTFKKLNSNMIYGCDMCFSEEVFMHLMVIFVVVN